MKHIVQQIHFVGIGGAGMSGIAEVLLNLGYQVSGSDLAESATTKRLRGLGADIQIGAPLGGRQIGARRTPAPIGTGGGLIISRAFLHAAIEIRITRNACLFGGADHRLRQFCRACVVRDIKRPTNAMEFIRPACLIFAFLEVRQHGIIIPARAAALAPGIIIPRIAPHIDHAIDRTCAAECLAARDKELPAI